MHFFCYNTFVMAISEKKISENAEYWNGRAAGYSDVNKWELAGESRSMWKTALKECISRHYPGRLLPCAVPDVSIPRTAPG